MRNLSSLLSLIFILLFFFLNEVNAQLHKNVDSIFNKYLHAKEPISGGSIVVVHNDSLILMKGYGMSDIENKIPFDATETVVQTASVTKLITTVAILKLLEQKKLSLNEPVENYFDNSPIYNPYDTKVTVKYLLTHTAGLDDRSTLMFAGSKKQIVPLSDYIENYLPEVVYEPGQFFNYSNHAFNLLAYLVEKVSKKSFNDYVKENILTPLDMSKSFVGYDDGSMNKLMRRYNLKGNNKDEVWQEEVPLRYTNLPGATDFKTTAKDMSNFLRMTLNSGTYKNTQVLKATTLEESFTPHFSYDADMHFKQGLGWRILQKNGITCIYHEGDSKGVESGLYLYPDHKLGIFVAFNNQIGYDIKKELRDSIVNLLVPTKLDSIVNYQAFTEFKKLTGRYYYMNDAQSNFEKIAYLFSNNYLDVIIKEDTLVVGNYKYLEYKPLTFNLIGYTGKLKFLKNKEGNITYLSFGTSTYRKLPWYQSPDIHKPVIIASFFILFTLLLIAFISFLMKKENKKTDKSYSIRLIHLNGVSILFFVIFLIITLNTARIDQEISNFLLVAFSFLLIACILLPFSYYEIFKLFRSKKSSTINKLLLTTESLSITMILIILYQYNFIGFQLY